MQHLVFEHDFALPVDRVYAWLAEHENLGHVFKPIKVTRLRDGDTRNGVGSARTMALGPLKFTETVTEAVPNERIAYTSSDGTPLKDHVGVMTFSSKGTGSHLHYTIDFDGKVPGLGFVIARALKGSVPKGLREVDKRA